jgi:acetyltransferase-like isoleucine patch superfamily enzyme
MGLIPRLLVRFVAHLAYRRDRAGSRLRAFWLRCRGVEVGRGCYVGPGVEVHLGPGATLRLGDGVVVKDYAAFFIGPGSSLEIGARTYVGRYCEIASNAHSRVGRDCAIAAFCTIIDTDHGYQDAALPVNAQEPRSEPVHIDDEVWLGYKATVLRGVHVGRHSVVGANAVVTRDVPAYCAVGGVPARVIKVIGAPDGKGDPDGRSLSVTPPRAKGERTQA